MNIAFLIIGVVIIILLYTIARNQVKQDKHELVIGQLLKRILDKLN